MIAYLIMTFLVISKLHNNYLLATSMPHLQLRLNVKLLYVYCIQYMIQRFTQAALSTESHWFSGYLKVLLNDAGQ